ncbi:hypothetical protein M0R45_034464 [Rubus argutus]|uniref:Uncharacterized protein n=1 Tax=Rubus argutus TaxID=59490 RepID=A0AAW1VS01_RUBAR
MANWLEVKLDLPQAIRLKKAVRAIGQVAFTDGDYPDECSPRFRTLPTSASLQGLYGDDFADDGIRYELEDDDGSIIHSSTLPVTEFEGQVDLSFLEYQFPMSIGLSSDLFCHVINELEIYGSTICSTVSENEVVFRVVNHELRFPREPGWCEIHSDANEYPFVLKFDLQHKSAFLNAAVLSEMVWIHKTTESLTVLDCPIEHLGNLLFNFL